MTDTKQTIELLRECKDKLTSAGRFNTNNGVYQQHETLLSKIDAHIAALSQPAPADMPKEPEGFDTWRALRRPPDHPQETFDRVMTYIDALRAWAQGRGKDNQKLRNGFANLSAELAKAPGLPLETCTPEQLAQWTDLLHGLSIALGVLESTGRPLTMWEALSDAAMREGKS